MYYTYMVRCVDNSLYTGITTNIERRIKEHKSKSNKCAKYTHNHTVLRLEAKWKSDDRALASKLEFYIKKLTKSEKEELIIKDNLEELLKDKINHKKYKRI